MDTNRILAELRTERERIERAIAAIEGLNSTGYQRAGRPPRAGATQKGRRHLSAAARRKLSRLLKQRWAEGKMKARANAMPARGSKPARRMSRAARKKIAAAQRARWAKVKAQGQAA